MKRNRSADLTETTLTEVMMMMMLSKKTYSNRNRKKGVVIFLWGMVFLLTIQLSKGVKLRDGVVSEFCKHAKGIPVNRMYYYKKDYSDPTTGMCRSWQSHKMNFGACSDQTGTVPWCLCSTGEDNPIRGSKAKEYCQFLLDDRPDSWMYPFRGRHPNPPEKDWTLQKDMDYQCAAAFHYCLALQDPPHPTDNVNKWLRQMVRFGPFNGALGLTDHAQSLAKYNGSRVRKMLTNRLYFREQAIAQEGLAFCIVGRHVRRSVLSKMGSLKGFLPLAERSFDIGNHIHPLDPTKMNRISFPAGHKEFFSKLRNTPRTSFPIRGYATQSKKDPKDEDWNKNTAEGILQHEYENVFMGFIPLNPWQGTVYKVPFNFQGLALLEDFMNRPAHPDFQPANNCKNPYAIKVTTIEADGQHLHNYLHIKVYSEDLRNPTESRCPTGRIKFLMLEVRDENGYPVGQFTDDIPCDRDDFTRNAKLSCPEGVECRRWTGTKENQMPCMFSHPKSTVHPWIFMVSAPDILNSGGASNDFGPAGDLGPGSISGPGGSKPGSGEGKGGPSSSDSEQEYCRNSRVPPKERVPPKVAYKVSNDYFTEVHATWRFAQMNNGWVKELHFATMIIEDESPIQYYTSRKTVWAGPATSNDEPCMSFKRPPILTQCERGLLVKEYYDCCIRLGQYPYNRCYCHTTWEWARSEFPDGTDSPRYPRQVFEDETGCFTWTQFWSGESRVGVYELALLNRCINETHNTNRPYGYSAKYEVLRPTFKTMGGWGHFKRQFVPPEDVNCHVDITSGDFYSFDSSVFGNPTLKLRPSLKDYLLNEYALTKTARYKNNNWTKKYEPPPETIKTNPYGNGTKFPHREKMYCTNYSDGSPNFVGLQHVPNVWELPDWHTIGLSLAKTDDDSKQLQLFYYFGHSAQSAAKKMFRSAHQDPIIMKTEFPDHPQREYFGSEHLLHPDADQENEPIELQRPNDLDQSMSMEEMSQKSRCPCPYIITTPPPELQTKSEREIDGRQVHVINTLFAWMVLVPIALFVARFYKETFSKVFFFQEAWWYTIHVLALLTALLFTFGGIYGLRIKRESGYEVVWTDATAVHIYSSYVLIGVFIIHLFLGAFRAYDVQLRVFQIALHFGIGWLEYCLAVVVILSATAIPFGMMNCASFGIFCGFIVFQVGMTLGMDFHMRYVVDKKLKLDPPRAYMPPPMMRLFHKDAPYSKCRVVMLVIFALGCCTFFAMVYLFNHLEGGEVGCFQPAAEKPKAQSIA